MQFDVKRTRADAAAIHRAQHLDVANGVEAKPLGDSMIGGTKTWLGPLIGALVLATVQQVATVTISSEINLLVVGVLLVGFVMLAPNGIVGLLRRR
jgi:ABC-type branched-subunit amino acid transport system permease subunit